MQQQQITNFIFRTSLLLVVLLLPFSTAIAQEPKTFLEGLGIVKDQVAGPSGLATADTPFELVNRIVLFISSIAGVVALGVFVWGAFQYITSLGDEGKAESAKKVMLYAIVGLVLMMLAFVIVRAAGYILGLQSQG